MIQGLEDYFRIKFDNISFKKEVFEKDKNSVLKLLNSEPGLKRWVNDKFKYTKYLSLGEKLNKIVDSFEELLDSLLGVSNSYENFSSNSTAYRNILAHGKITKTYQGEGFEKVFNLAQFLLTLCVLNLLKISNSDIALKFKSNKLTQNIIASLHE